MKKIILISLLLVCLFLIGCAEDKVNNKEDALVGQAGYAGEWAKEKSPISNSKSPIKESIPSGKKRFLKSESQQKQLEKSFSCDDQINDCGLATDSELGYYVTKEELTELIEVISKSMNENLKVMKSQDQKIEMLNDYVGGPLIEVINENRKDINVLLEKEVGEPIKEEVTLTWECPDQIWETKLLEDILSAGSVLDLSSKITFAGTPVEVELSDCSYNDFCNGQKYESKHDFCMMEVRCPVYGNLFLGLVELELSDLVIWSESFRCPVSYTYEHKDGSYDVTEDISNRYKSVFYNAHVVPVGKINEDFFYWVISEEKAYRILTPSLYGSN